MKITVVIATQVVPFDNVVNGVYHFEDVAEATAFINDESWQWWVENGGGDAVLAGIAEPYQPITELGYDHAYYEIAGEERTFEAMIDAESYAILQEEHYRKLYDDKGITRPGYLIDAYLAGEKPGGSTKEEMAEYRKQRDEGLQALYDYYDKVEH